MGKIRPAGWVWLALLAAIAVSTYSAFRAEPPGAGTVIVTAVLAGDTAPMGDHAKVYTGADPRGQALYAFDTAVYGERGYVPPWENFLVLRALDAPTARTFSLSLPAGTFLMHPALSPDGRVIAFKVGRGEPGRTALALYLLDIETQTVTPVGKPGEKICGWRPLCWSPGGRYLAYTSGDYHWGETRYQPPALWVYDRERDATRRIIQAHELLAHAAWRAEGRLLYSLFPEPFNLPRTVARATDRLPGIYECDLAGTRAARRIIPNATEPTVSPDGRWIAALATDGAKPGGMWPFQRRLTLYPSAGGTPIPLAARDGGSGTAVCWSADSTRLFIFADRYTPTRLAISAYTLATARETALTAIPNEMLADPVTAIHGIAPLGPSHDGRILYFCQVGEKENTAHIGFRHLQALDLSTGAIRTIYAVDGHGALAWRETEP